jgi:RNA polymerase sigma-70 factor (ECF subfamily)
MDDGITVSDRWADLVRQIRQGNERCAEQLCIELIQHSRLTLLRAVESQAVEDRLQEIVVIVFEAIRTGELRDPKRLKGFARTVTRRRVLAHIRHKAFQRRYFADGEATVPHASVDLSPEALLLRHERLAILRTVLQCLQVRDREILSRFYLQEQSPRQICREMHLSDTQFRLYKSRAKARCSMLALSFREHSDAAKAR